MTEERVSNQSNRLLSIADKYSIHLQHWQWLRLQQYGRLHWLRLNIDTGRHDFAMPIFLTALLRAKCYQQLILDHTTMHWPGLHGPFRIDRLALDDYADLLPERAIMEIQAVLQAKKWLAPELPYELRGPLTNWLEQHRDSGTQALRLERCRAFNSQAKTGDVHEHEWSHALLEFHEYMFVSEERNICDLLYLVYE